MPTQHDTTHDVLGGRPIAAREAPSRTVTVTDVTGRSVGERVRSTPVPRAASGRDRKPHSPVRHARPGNQHRSAGTAVVVRAVGEVDTATAPVLAAALRTGCTAARSPGPLVVDLTGLRFLSAAGLTPLVTTLWRCVERRVPLRVVAAHRDVLRPLHLTGLDALFDIRPSLAEALGPGAGPR